jgi:hypothetical protein
MINTLRPSKMVQKIAYILGAIAYGILLIVYVKEPLLNLLEGLPKPLASFLFILSFVPVLILLGVSAGINTTMQKQKGGNNV